MSTHKRVKLSLADLELLYFDIPGKGEPIRLFCKYIGLQFKDTRLSRDDFISLRDQGKLAFDQLPCLRSGDHYLVQSGAILRYLSRLAGHFPEDLTTAALVDAVMDQVHDLYAGLSVARYRERFGFEAVEASALAEVTRALNDRVIPRHLGFFERLLESSTSGWIANTEEPSVADFALVPRVQELPGSAPGISPEVLQPFPKLLGLIEKFNSLFTEE